MAVVEPVQKAIKAHQYVTDSISYILSPENRNGDEKCFKATCLNCANDGAEGIASQFFETRRAFNKDNERLAHHYVQSFSPNEQITPELAHQIGVELAQKMYPGFQVVVSTHVDRNHIHNHIILNSVNMETGMKWKNNKTTLKAIWQESDKLCKQYGLTTIERQSGLRGIDQATQKLGEKGKSWKVELCKALEEAAKLCNTKEQFIAFMKRKGFEITRYTDLHITFRKIGEDKKIRADTLAKQFGDFYKKENLEKRMGFYSKPKAQEHPQAKPKRPPAPYVSEFERFERSFFVDNPPPVTPNEAKRMQQRIKASKNPLLVLFSIVRKLLFRQKLKAALDTEYAYLHQGAKKQKSYKMKTPVFSELTERYNEKPAAIGNILYRDLMKAQGENYRVKISLSALPKLYAYPFFFSAKVYGDYAVVTIKEKDKVLLQKALELEDEKTIDRHNSYYTPMSDYQELKKRAKQLGTKIEFLMIQPEQLEALDNEKDRFVALPTKDGKIRLAFLPQNKNFILHALYPDKFQSKADDLFSVGRNSKVNTRLKSEALLGGQKMRYRELTKEQVEQLGHSEETKDLFAVFSKNAKGENLNGKYNIAFKEEDQEKIETELKKPRTTKRKI